MSWHTGLLVGFDTETTGVNVFEDRIVAACVVKVPPTGRPVSRSWLINPQVEIPVEATNVHGITTEHVRACGDDPAIAVFEITGALALAMVRGTPVVAFNAAFDLSLLEAENRRYELPTLTERLGRPVSPVIDPMVLDKECSHRKGKRRLGDVCEHYKVTLPGAHTADDDALASVRLARVIGRQNQGLARMSVGELHAAQVRWRGEQQASLAAWFTSQGRPCDDVSTEWPVRKELVAS